MSKGDGSACSTHPGALQRAGASADTFSLGPQEIRPVITLVVGAVRRHFRPHFIACSPRPAWRSCEPTLRHTSPEGRSPSSLSSSGWKRRIACRRRPEPGPLTLLYSTPPTPGPPGRLECQGRQQQPVGSSASSSTASGSSKSSGNGSGSGLPPQAVVAGPRRMNRWIFSLAPLRSMTGKPPEVSLGAVHPHARLHHHRSPVAEAAPHAARCDDRILRETHFLRPLQHD